MLSDMSDTDMELLARYTRQHAEDAFAELVRRHLGLVYSAALRMVCDSLIAPVGSPLHFPARRAADRSRFHDGPTKVLGFPARNTLKEKPRSLSNGLNWLRVVG